MSTGIDDTSRTHASLLLQVRDLGNQQAWAEFDRRYRPMIWGWCRLRFPRETDDKVQDVYLKLVAGLRTFEYDPAKGRFRGWLKTLTFRLLADPPESPLRAAPDGEAIVNEAEARQDLLERLAAEYDLELLEEAMTRVRDCVEERTWSVYVETAVQRRSPVTVAHELGMRVGAVYQAKHRVLTELKSAVQVLESLARWEVPP